MLRRKQVRLVVSRCLQGRGSGAESNNVLCTCETIFNRTQTGFFLFHLIPFLKRLIATQQSAHCLLMFRPVHIYKFVLNVIAAQREHCLRCYSLQLEFTKSHPLGFNHILYDSFTLVISTYAPSGFGKADQHIFDQVSGGDVMIIEFSLTVELK